MKILMISMVRPYRGSGSGLTEYAYQLIKHIKPLLQKRGSIDEMYALNEAKKNNAVGLLSANTSFKRKITKIPNDKYDVIHILDQELGFAAKMLKKAHNTAKVMTTVHDLSRFEKDLHRGLSQKVYNKLVQGSIKDAIKYSDFILCNSSQTLNTVIGRFGSIKNIKVVLHGTNDAIIKAKIPKRKPHKKFTIGYIGALMKHKNVIFLLKAAGILKSEPEYKFVIYGTGIDKNILLRFKQDSSLDNVEFNGYLKEDNKLKAYDGFNAFAFPSLYEGLGYPILEAQTCGLPVIIYKYAKIPKEVRKYCFKAESPEHMAQIIEDLKENGYNEKLRKKATEYARSFTWERCVRETFEIYIRLCE